MLTPKYEKWLEKAMRREKDYALIGRREGGWYYIDNEIIEEISSITIVICKGDQFHHFFDWDVEQKSENKRDFLIVIKDEKKMMLSDNTEGLFTFGLSESDDSAKKILILFKTEGVSTIITATKEAQQVDMSYVMQHSQTDTFHECMRQIIFNLSENEALEKGGEDDAVSVDQVDNESLGE